MKNFIVPEGVVVGTSNDVASLYQEKCAIVQGVAGNLNGFEYAFSKAKDEAFREILKTIIIDNAVYTKEGKIKLKSTIRAIFDSHNGNKPACFKCDSDEKYVSVLVDNFQNWIGDWDDEKISLHSKTPSSSFIIKDRSLLIDFLLYFHYKHFQSEIYQENVKEFNRILEKFNYGSLYLMNYQEFSVLSAFKFIKGGENIYARFLDIYSNDDFKELISDFNDLDEACAISNDEDGEEVFTLQMIRDFNENVICCGSNKDLIVKKEPGDTMSLYQFVSLYKNAFGRCHLSSYRLLNLIILGWTLGKKLWGKSWTHDAMFKVSFGAKEVLEKEESDFVALFNTVCEKVYTQILNRDKASAIEKRKRDYYIELEVIQDRNNARHGNKRATIFDTECAKVICQEFLTLNHIKWLNEKEDPTTVDLDRILDEDVKQRWHDECERFFFAELKKGVGIRAQNEIIDDVSNHNIIGGFIADRTESVPKEFLVWVFILFLRSDVLKTYIAGRTALSNPDKIGDAIFKVFNHIFIRIGMSSLHANFSKEEFLLVNAIYHVDYRKIYSSKEVYYPFREYVFDEIFKSITVKDNVAEFLEINDLLS